MRDRRMMAFEQALTAGDRSSSEVPPERLRLLGKQASARYARDGGALTDAVVDVLRDQQGLGPEHVRRVTEFANTYAFDDAFRKEAGYHRVINFDRGPADPSSVMKELRMDPTPTATSPSLSQPSGYVPGEDGIDAMFGGQQKTAGQMVRTRDYPMADPYRHVIELWENLTATREKIAGDLSMLENDYITTSDQLYGEARQVLYDGYSPADVSAVVASASPTVGHVKLALKMISERMDRDGVPASANMSKAASVRLANSEHPLFQAVKQFVKVAEARFNHVAALEQVNEQLVSVRRRLREVVQ